MRVVRSIAIDRHTDTWLNLEDSARVVSFRMDHLGEFSASIVSEQFLPDDAQERAFRVIQTGQDVPDHFDVVASHVAGGVEWHLLEIRFEEQL